MIVLFRALVLVGLGKWWEWRSARLSPRILPNRSCGLGHQRLGQKRQSLGVWVSRVLAGLGTTRRASSLGCRRLTTCWCQSAAATYSLFYGGAVSSSSRASR